MFDAGNYMTVEAAQAAFEAAWTGDAYQHYLQYGSAEGVNPSNAFDESSYLASKLAALQADTATATEWAAKTAADVQAAFAAAGLTALGHYIAYGEDEAIAVTAVPASEQVASSDTTTAVEGETFTLTADLDTAPAFTGTSGNDTYVATDTTFTTGDNLNGGAGTDTLNAIFGNDGVTPVVDLTDIENVSLRNADATPAGLVLDASGWTGVTTITALRPVGNVTVNNVAALTALAVNQGSGTGIDFTVDFANGVVSGAADAVTLNLSSADAGTVEAGDGVTDGFEAINVVATGENTLDDITSTDLTDVVISGTGSLEITASSLALDILTSTATGGVVINALTLNEDGAVTLGDADDELTAVTLNATATATITLGGGDDTISVIGLINGDAASIDGGAGDDSITVDDLIDSVTIAGGDGTDTLNVATAVAGALDADAILSGIETLAITNALANNFTLSDFGGATRLSLEVGAASAGTVDIESGNTIAYDQAALVTANVTSGAIIAAVDGASTAGSNDDVVNIEVNADFDGLAADVFTADVSVDFVETVNIIVTDPDTDTSGGGENVVISIEDGDRIDTITVNADVATSIVEDTTNFTALNIVNASDSTAGVTIDVTNATQGVQITGGSGDDFFTGNAFADEINGGAGNDVIVGAGEADLINVGT
ncbi:MAG: hypothetical protein PHP23_13590, partial [Desulfobacterales bacterium]|nr:hypothetical protein [Desulfobacterales bacterium]